MGILKNKLSFVVGIFCGVYIGQNYDVPDVKKLVTTGIRKAKDIEQTYRKPKKKDDGDDQ